MDSDVLCDIEDLKNYETTPAVACCELIPFELTSVTGNADFVDDFFYASSHDQYQYPSASASYLENECEQNFVNLLDTDFLDIYDELAKEDDRFEFGPSPVAMPIVYAVSEAEFIAKAICSSIQHATLIDSSNENELSSMKVKSTEVSNVKLKSTEAVASVATVRIDYVSDFLMRRSTSQLRDKATLDKQKAIRNSAIMKWKKKKTQGVCKSIASCTKSARQEATARRPRSHGKFNKVKAKWVAATDYFRSALSTENADDTPALGVLGTSLT